MQGEKDVPDGDRATGHLGECEMRAGAVFARVALGAWWNTHCHRDSQYGILGDANSLSGTRVHHREGTARRGDDCHPELQALPKAARVAPQMESLNSVP